MVGHQAAREPTSAPPQQAALPNGVPRHVNGQMQPQPAQKLNGAAASTALRPHAQGSTHLIRKLAPGTVYVTSGHHQFQQSMPPKEFSAQPLSQPAHSLVAESSGQAGASAAAAQSEQQGPPLTETAYKAQPALHASMQRPAVPEACPAQPSQHQQPMVQTPTAQQTGQHLSREQSTHPPQHQQNTQELRQQLQVPQASGRDAGSAAPGMSQQQEQQRPHAQANGRAEGMAEAKQESWSSTDGDDDFADWEQHILASAAPEPAGAGTEQQSGGKSGLSCLKAPHAYQQNVCQDAAQRHASFELIAACNMHIVKLHRQTIEKYDASGTRADHAGLESTSPHHTSEILGIA